MHLLRRSELEVAIVSANPETLDGLQSYLGSAGVKTRSTRDLASSVANAPETTTAFIVFPDDFGGDVVRSAIASMAERIGALHVLVTSHPQRFQEMVSPGRVMVVPRPAWGWTILEAIRAHFDRETSREQVSRRRKAVT